MAEEHEQDNSRRRRPQAKTIEGRENQLINLAFDLAEKRLREGTATSQEVTHFLKLGSVNNRYEQELLKNQVELTKAKTESLASAKAVEELYKNAKDAFSRYSGRPLGDDIE